LIRVAVCDDICEHKDAVMSLLNLYQSERVGVEISASEFTSGVSLLENIAKGQRFDIYLLDIIMPEINGIELSQKIQEQDTDTTLIFQTQSTDHALEAYGVSAAQYMLKPINKESLFHALDRFIAARKREKDNFIMVSVSDNRTVKVLYSSIVVVERVGRVMRFHMNNGETLNSKTIRCPFESALEKLLQDSRFLCVHQSFVINMDHVRELRKWSFLMSNDMDVPIPRPKYTGIKNLYMEYLAEIGAWVTGGSKE
jgi:DNA-binding LytR/AlgR family response regulator